MRVCPAGPQVMEKHARPGFNKRLFYILWRNLSHGGSERKITVMVVPGNPMDTGIFGGSMLINQARKTNGCVITN